MVYGRQEVWLHAYLNSALEGGEWLDLGRGNFGRGGRAHGTHFIGGWLGPRAGLGAVEERMRGTYHSIDSTYSQALISRFFRMFELSIMTS
jgi:hypothetical protein